MYMVDWITGKLPFFSPGIIADGEILSLKPTGEIEYSMKKRKQLTGSYDSRISIRTAEIDQEGNTKAIELSGNPVKFLQGHNLFGTADLLNLIPETIIKIADMLKTQQPTAILDAIYRGAYTLSRIDINVMLMLGSRADVISYLYTMSQNCRTRSQAATSHGSTVYMNKNSRRWNFKCYSKAQEIGLKRNRKQQSLEFPGSLKEWAEPTLRLELTLKSNELRERNLHTAANWNTIGIPNLFNEYAGRIEMPSQKVTGNLLLEIKERAARSTYQLWVDGHDPRQLLPNRTFYRHRRILLKYGIDISVYVPKKPDPNANVVPFTKALELKPAVLPDWVKDSEYYFEPRQLFRG